MPAWGGSAAMPEYATASGSSRPAIDRPAIRSGQGMARSGVVAEDKDIGEQVPTSEWPV